MGEPQKKMMSAEFYVAMRALRTYANVLFMSSIFYFGLSIISFFYQRPLLGFLGMLSFFSSAIVSVFLLLNAVSYTNSSARWNVVAVNFFNAVYFGIAAWFEMNNENSTMGYVIVNGVFCALAMISTIVGFFLLDRVQEIRHDEEQDEPHMYESIVSDS
eukprot:CAMPEP_0178952166 /NCGR_PEP_ID=MMETSP0789-20121207/7648_1 /TAXON_ID=3005 /ORGANISM="Rhizosolenia setigera, Strain CCMP 1694" /LENGTH=158 /DNA_ID=CAMNT_0020633155 /DNA_START=97 /DNA_END=573 /DNA_ORIENTATION=-